MSELKKLNAEETHSLLVIGILLTIIFGVIIGLMFKKGHKRGHSKGIKKPSKLFMTILIIGLLGSIVMMCFGIFYETKLTPPSSKSSVTSGPTTTTTTSTVTQRPKPVLQSMMSENDIRTNANTMIKDMPPSMITCPSLKMIYDQSKNSMNNTNMTQFEKDMSLKVTNDMFNIIYYDKKLDCPYH